MKILFDIKHPAQLNLFKGLSQELTKEGWEVTICYLQRGKLPKIIQREYDGFKTIPVGSSAGTKWSIIWDGNLKRTISFINLIRRNRYNICVAASSVPLAFACKLLNVPIIQFYDDPERGKISDLNALLSNQLFFPPIVDKDNKKSTFNCLKEWSYLSPKRFKASTDILQKYGLTPYNYIFIREVSNKSFNYYDQDDAIVCRMSHQIDSSVPVVLSLEDKSIAHKFPSNWIILEEPVGDIHSLIHYSKLVVSSGDSMAREGAMLGVPSVYCGIRKMKANDVLIKLGLLQHLPKEESLPFINEQINRDFNEELQNDVRDKLSANWDDMVTFMKEQIYNYKY